MNWSLGSFKATVFTSSQRKGCAPSYRPTNLFAIHSVYVLRHCSHRTVGRLLVWLRRCLHKWRGFREVYVLSAGRLERFTAPITGVHSNQDEILLVKIREYLGFYIDRTS